MSRLEELQKSVEIIRGLVKDEFPEYTNASVTIGKDGFSSVTILEWDENVDGETSNRKRRELLTVYGHNGEYGEDRSIAMNDFYKKLGLLLEDEK